MGLIDLSRPAVAALSSSPFPWGHLSKIASSWLYSSTQDILITGSGVGGKDFYLAVKWIYFLCVSCLADGLGGSGIHTLGWIKAQNLWQETAGDTVATQNFSAPLASRFSMSYSSTLHCNITQRHACLPYNIKCSAESHPHSPQLLLFPDLNPCFYTYPNSSSHSVQQSKQSFFPLSSPVVMVTKRQVQRKNHVARLDAKFELFRGDLLRPLHFFSSWMHVINKLQSVWLVLTV